MIAAEEQAQYLANTLADECDYVLQEFAPDLDARARAQVSRLVAGACIVALLDDSRAFTAADLAWPMSERLGAVERYCEAFLVGPNEVSAQHLVGCLCTIDPRYGNAGVEYCAAIAARHKKPRHLAAAITAATLALGSSGDEAKDRNRFKSAERPAHDSDVRLTFTLIHAGTVYAQRAGLSDSHLHAVRVILARGAVAARRGDFDLLARIAGRVNGIEALRGIALDVLSRALEGGVHAAEVRHRLTLVDLRFLAADVEAFRELLDQIVPLSKGGERGVHWLLAMLMRETGALDAEAWLEGDAAVEQLAQRLRSCKAEER